MNTKCNRADRAKECDHFAIQSSRAQTSFDSNNLATRSTHACCSRIQQRASQTYARVVYLEPHHGPALLALAELSDALGRSDEANRFRAKMKRLENL